MGETEVEVQLGKALGPFDAWEMHEQIGALWVPAPRVGPAAGQGAPHIFHSGMS